MGQTEPWALNPVDVWKCQECETVYGVWEDPEGFAIDPPSCPNCLDSNHQDYLGSGRAEFREWQDGEEQ